MFNADSKCAIILQDNSITTDHLIMKTWTGCRQSSVYWLKVFFVKKHKYSISGTNCLRFALLEGITLKVGTVGSWNTESVNMFLSSNFNYSNGYSPIAPNMTQICIIFPMKRIRRIHNCPEILLYALFNLPCYTFNFRLRIHKYKMLHEIHK